MHFCCVNGCKIHKKCNSVEQYTQQKCISIMYYLSEILENVCYLKIFVSLHSTNTTKLYFCCVFCSIKSFEKECLIYQIIEQMSYFPLLLHFSFYQFQIFFSFDKLQLLLLHDNHNERKKNFEKIFILKYRQI